MGFYRWFAGKEMAIRNGIDGVSSVSAAATQEREKNAVDFEDLVFF